MNNAERISLSLKVQRECGIQMNPDAAIGKKIEADGFRRVHSELYDGLLAYQGAEHPQTGESRLYQWTAAEGVWWIPRPTGNEPVPPPDPPKGRLKTLIGLHARADGGDLDEDEFVEFRDLRPGIIKVMSSTSAESVQNLALENHPSIWVIRAFLSFANGRTVFPEEFVEWTYPDVERTIAIIQEVGSLGEIVVELHNEPNLSTEGLTHSWSNGQFAGWINKVLVAYRREMPDIEYCYPGLSPGKDMDRPVIRRNHLSFLRETRKAINEFDYLGCHAYWGEGGNMQEALEVVANTQHMFPHKPILVTEASNNSSHPSAATKSAEYAHFARLLGDHGLADGVTYFVASASNPTFEPETWAGKGIGKMTRRAI